MRSTAMMLVTIAWGVMAATVGCHSQAISDEAGARETGRRAAATLYVFSVKPSWTGEVTMTDHADPASPGRRMLILAARATDGRHVVLVQSPTYNRMFRSRVRQGGVLVYTSPNGFKIWSGGPQKWYSGVLLRSARTTIRDSPAANRTGYVLESPAGTFPALAINGPITDGELRRLVDSLVPNEECRGRSSDSPPRSDAPEDLLTQDMGRQ